MGRYKGKMFTLTCKVCNKKIQITPSRINITKCCSRKCRDIFTKGKHFSSKTEIKKGQHLSKKTEFKKGMIPWDKGMKGIFIKEKARHWKGGKIINRGYVHIFKPEHPFCIHKRYVLRSHLVVEKLINRFIQPKEVVHHINKIKTDDRPENLMLFKSNGYHIAFHRWKHCNLESIIFDGRLL